MLITNKEYDKMIENYNFDNLPEIINEIRENVIDKFENHSESSENRFIANRPNSKALAFASEFWGHNN